MALLLSLTASHRLEKQVSSYIISSMMSSYRAKASKLNSKFFSWTIQQIHKRDNSITDDGGLFDDIDNVLENLASDCKMGWEFIVPSLVEICFQLFNFYDKSCSCLHPALILFPIENINAHLLNSKLFAIRASLRCLSAVFSNHPASRSTVVKKLFHSIITTEKERQKSLTELDSQVNEDFSPPMVLLGQLIGRNQVIFFEFITEIRNSFDYLVNFLYNPVILLKVSYEFL